MVHNISMLILGEPATDGIKAKMALQAQLPAAGVPVSR
jgi:hypothetical protein